MKKLVACLLAFSLIGCASKDPKKVLTKAYMKDQDTVSMTMDGEMTVDMNIEGLNLSLPVDLDIMYDLGDKNDAADDKYYVSAGISLLGQTMDVKLWMADGMMYMDTMGQKVSSEIEVQNPGSQEKAAFMSQFLETLEDLTLEKDGDDQVITGTVNKEKLLALYHAVLERYGESDDLDEAMDTLSEFFESIEFGDIRIRIGKDGYISQIDLSGTMTIEDTAGTMTSSFVLKDRNATVLPAFDPSAFTQSTDEMPDVTEFLDDEPLEDADEEVLLDEYSINIWFDEGGEYWIRTPKEKQVSVYYDDEENMLYFFDDEAQDVLSDGFFLETPTLTSLEAQVAADTENYSQVRSVNDRGMIITEYQVLNETDLFYPDTRTTFILYPDRPYSLIMIDEKDDHERYTEIMSAVDFDFEH